MGNQRAARKAVQAEPLVLHAGDGRRDSVRRPLATPSDLAAHLVVSELTLRDWRYHRKGPKWTVVGRHVRYDWKHVDEWLAEQSREAA